MLQLAEQAPRDRTDLWLKDILAGVLDTSGTIKVDRAELWTLLDSLPVAILISTDRACTNMVGNRAAQSLLKVPLGSNLSQTAHQEDLPRFKVYTEGELADPLELPMQRAARTGLRESRSECEIRFEDGSRLFIAGHCIPIQNDAGEVCGSLGAFVDVTEQRKSYNNSTLVAREMSHRVHNTVALIQALAHGTIRKQLPASDYEDFERRLLSLGRAQDLVNKTAASDVSLADLMRGSIEKVAHDAFSRVTLDGPMLPVRAELVLPLSMIFHELTTNACKYGALNATEGVVKIEWKLEEGAHGSTVAVNWVESGGPPVEPPKQFGFGSKLIRRILSDLPSGAMQTTFAATGLSISLEFALQ